MGVTMKGRCVKTQFDREILCAGTMIDLIEILSRSIGGTEPGQDTQPTEAFTLIDSVAGYNEAKKDTPRWNGVSTEDQAAANFTHACYIPFDLSYYTLDINTLFIRITRQTTRLFKLKGIKDWGEQEEYLQLKTAETGFESLDAAKG